MVQYFVRKKDAEGKTEDEIVEIIEGKTKFPSMKQYYEIGKVVGIDWERLKKQPLAIDAVATALTVYKTDEDIKKNWKKLFWKMA